MSNNTTPFSLVYEAFLSKITDDMYLELNEIETYQMLEELLISAIFKFEFPRVSLEYDQILSDFPNTYCGVLSDFELVPAEIYNGGFFINHLTEEEINIIAVYMVVEWFGIQLASVDVTRMHVSGSDFKFTSQGNHMQKLLQMKKDWEREGFHLQRLYKRREKDKDGKIRSTFHTIMGG